MQEIMSSKKQERRERKRKKLAALASIVELNDKDTYIKAHRARSTSLNESVTTSDEFDDDNVDYYQKPVRRKFSSESGDGNGDGDGNANVSVNININVTVNEKFDHADKTATQNKSDEKNTSTDSESSPKPKRKKLNSVSETSRKKKTKSPTKNNNNHNNHNHKEKKIDNKNQLSELLFNQNSRKVELFGIGDNNASAIKELPKVPVFKLSDIGVKAHIDVPESQRVPIFLTDIQHLLMLSLLKQNSPCIPNRWCNFDDLMSLRRTVVVLLDGCSLFHYLDHQSQFERSNKIFDTKIEMVMPPYKPNAMIEEILKVPLTTLQADDLIQTYGSLEAAVEMVKDPTLIVNRIFNIKPQDENAPRILHPEDKFPRTKLLLSALQMVEEGYPLPLPGEFALRYESYKMTCDSYLPVTDQSPMFGIDCEMCRTVAGINELTRISIVDEKLQSIYETLVRPDNKIIDYLTQYSGITAEIMMPVTKTLADVQRDVRKLIPPDGILVGQSLQSDLKAMRMMHPYVIDTSVIFNMTGCRKRKSKLQKLAFNFLKEAIQVNADGHDSIEDSIATMKLVKLKLAKSIEYGDQILSDRKRYHDILNMSRDRAVQNNLIACLKKFQRTSAIVSACPIDTSVKDLLNKYQADLDEKLVSHFEVDHNKEVLQKTKELLEADCDLVIANLKFTEVDLNMQKSQQTLQQLDKWINKIWKTINQSALFVVLMGGTNECPNGLAKITLKANANNDGSNNNN